MNELTPEEQEEAKAQFKEDMREHREIVRKTYPKGTHEGLKPVSDQPTILDDVVNIEGLMKDFEKVEGPYTDNSKLPPDEQLLHAYKGKHKQYTINAKHYSNHLLETSYKVIKAKLPENRKLKPFCEFVKRQAILFEQHERMSFHNKGIAVLTNALEEKAKNSNKLIEELKGKLNSKIVLGKDTRVHLECALADEEKNFKEIMEKATKYNKVLNSQGKDEI